MKMFKKDGDPKKPKVKAVAVKMRTAKTPVKSVAVMAKVKPLDEARMPNPMMKKIMKKK